MKNRFSVVELQSCVDEIGNTYWDVKRVKVFASFKAFTKEYFPDWDHAEYMRKSKLFRLEVKKTDSYGGFYIDCYFMAFGKKLELYKYEFIK